MRFIDIRINDGASLDNHAFYFQLTADFVQNRIIPNYAIGILGFRFMGVIPSSDEPFSAFFSKCYF